MLSEEEVRRGIAAFELAIASLDGDCRKNVPDLRRIFGDELKGLQKRLHNMQKFPWSDGTRHLSNMIDDAESDTGIKVLRSVLRTAADKATDSAVLRMAKALLQSRIDYEQGDWIRQN